MALRFEFWVSEDADRHVGLDRLRTQRLSSEIKIQVLALKRPTLEAVFSVAEFK